MLVDMLRDDKTRNEVQKIGWGLMREDAFETWFGNKGFWRKTVLYMFPALREASR